MRIDNVTGSSLMVNVLNMFVGLFVVACIIPGSTSLAGGAPAAGGGGPIIIYVDGRATGAGNGTSWADACISLQVALEAAVSGSQIWVAEGTYVPGIDRTSTFQLKNGVELYGGFPRGGGTMDNRDPWRYTTILSGEIGNPDQETDNCWHVVTGSGTDSTAVLDGFRVTEGHASGEHEEAGGGMINTAGSPTIRNAVFLRNYASKYGGAIANWSSSPTMENVTFYGNRADAWGGAVENYHESRPDISNALFVGNTAPAAAAVYNGDASSLVLRNVTVVTNEAEGGASALYTDGTSGAAVMNSIVWDNSPHQIIVNASAGGTTSVYASIVQGGCPADVTCEHTNADEPLFIRMPSPGVTVQAGPPPASWGDEDDVYGDLRVEANSPAIDSGSNAYLKPGLFTDLMGNPRLVDGLDDAVTSMGGGGPTIDRGAYEAPPMPIYVDEAASGTNDGTTWANAFNDLQDAFLWGRSGVAEIWVAKGRYLPGNLRTSTFQLLDAFTVYGGFPPGGGDGTFAARDWERQWTRLSGDVGAAGVATDNVYHVVTASDVNYATLHGVRISRGYADGSGLGEDLGGGVYAPHGYPELSHVSVTGNHAEGGGGGAYFKESQARLTDVVFSGNSTDGGGGGLLLLDGSQFVIEDGIFGPNTAAKGGGGLYAEGGRLTVRDTEFRENQADGGGGMHLSDISAYLSGIRFVLNRSDHDGGGLLVGLMGDVTVSDCLFSVNSAEGHGGAVAAGESDLTLTNVTLSGNSAGGDGGAAYLVLNTPATFANTILWANAAAGTGDQVHLDDTSDLTSSHNLIEYGCPAGATCSDTVKDDPLFYVDPSAGNDRIWGTPDDEPGDLRLWKVSPAIDAGDSYAAGWNRWDLVGNPRLVDVASVADTGVGPDSMPVVDIGAYESPPDVIHVDQAAGGACSGLSWTDAFTDVQNALGWGSSGPADVWVAQGTYVPGARRSDAFDLVKGVSLYGGFPTGGEDGTFEVRDWRAYTTTLSGEIGLSDHRDDNSYHVMVGRHVDQTVRVDGFVVSGGNAGPVPSIFPVISRCTLDNPHYGGGLCLFHSRPVLTNLTFQDNYAWKGGGAELSQSSPLMANVAFIGNQASHEGGGLDNVGSELTLINALFVGNLADDGGGAMWNNESSLTILNATLAGNHAGAGGAMTNVSDTSVALTNTILWANTTDAGPPVSSEAGCTVAADHSLLEGGCPAGAACTHVLDSDPAFVRDPDPGGDATWGTADDDLGDLRLQISSPAIDAGDSEAFPGSITTDVMGSLRLVDVPAIPNTGTGGVPIDMGAYEYANTPPTAMDDAYTTTDDAPLRVEAPGVLANDSDPDGHLLIALKDSDPSSGTVTLDLDGSFVYTPSPGSTGVVTFAYHARDGYSTSNLATVTISVTKGNKPPVAVDDGYTTGENTPLSVDPPGVLANDSDPDGDPLTAAKDSDPVSGSLILKAHGSFLYTPAPDTTGVFTFTYHAEDATASSNIATVTITVTAGNVPPTISDIPDQATSPGTPLGPLSFTVGDVETPTEALTLSAQSSNATLAPTENIAFGGSGANRTVTITPAPGHTGEAVITLIVDDGTDSASDTFTVTVGPFRIYLPLIVGN